MREEITFLMVSCKADVGFDSLICPWVLCCARLDRVEYRWLGGPVHASNTVLLVISGGSQPGRLTLLHHESNDHRSAAPQLHCALSCNLPT